MRLKNLDFRGERLNFVQIGLGTNCTFIQNLNGQVNEWSRAIDWLMSAATEKRPSRVRGIAVEPVSELVDALKDAVDDLPGVEIVQAAMGEKDATDVELNVFAPSARDAVLHQVPPNKRARLGEKLEYILNMSCVGGTHPMLPALRQQIADEFNVHVSADSQRAEIWSWGKLVQTCGFEGCEVLLIDAEGHDARILRSVIEHCKNEPTSFPWLIQFETMGHCDRFDGPNTEWNIISELQEAGYTLVNYSNHNTNMVYRDAWQNEPKIRNWVQDWVCKSCKAHWAFPYVSAREGIFCRRCVRNGEHRRFRDLAWVGWPIGCNSSSPSGSFSSSPWSRTAAPAGGPSAWTAAPQGGPAAWNWTNGSSSSGGSSASGWSSTETETWTAPSGWSGSSTYSMSETRSGGWKEHKWSTHPNGWSGSSGTSRDGRSNARGGWDGNPSWTDGNRNDPRDDRHWPSS